MAKETVDQIRQRLAFQQDAAVRALNSQDGKDLLAYLQAKYGGPAYVPGDPHATSYRLGEQAVLIYLNVLQEVKDV